MSQGSYSCEPYQKSKKSCPFTFLFFYFKQYYKIFILKQSTDFYLILLQLYMGVCVPIATPQLITSVDKPKISQFSADIRSLHKKYVKIVLYVRDTRLFAQRNQKLTRSTQLYFANNFQFDQNDLDIASVDSVRKLHPRDYWFTKIDHQWLIQACLRQQKFSDQTKVEAITYEHAYPEYLQFLQMCRFNYQKKNGAITVPTKCQDVIWHSHMQDPVKYKADTINFMGKLLNHMDDIPDNQLKVHSQNTKKLAKEMHGPKLQEQIKKEPKLEALAAQNQ